MNLAIGAQQKGAPRIGVRGIGAASFCVALILFVLLAARPGAATPETFRLAGRVSGAFGQKCTICGTVAGRRISDEGGARSKD
jgi:hypothetical protein